MSAYMVDKAHVDALIRAALADPGFPLSWWHPFGAEDSERAELHAGDLDEANRVGAMLARENLASIHRRYPDTVASPDATPGPVARWWEEEYRYPVGTRLLEPVEVLKAVDCYEYQSCEHEGWEASEARAFCEALRRSAIRNLPGYDDAAWGVTS